MIETSETIAKHTEWAVQRPDGRLLLLSSTGAQAESDARGIAGNMNAQLERMGLGDERGLRARLKRRVVTTTVVTTRKSDGWERA
jgi:hypothetical protein